MSHQRLVLAVVSVFSTSLTSSVIAQQSPLDALQVARQHAQRGPLSVDQLRAIETAWKPQTQTQAAATPSTPLIFTQSADLDRHVIYQDFSFYQPYDSTAYTTLAGQADDLRNLGITDVWFAPPYRALESFFEEGYAVADRYDLGQFPAGHAGAAATKYGTSAQLMQAIDKLHGDHINAIADIVPNQLFIGSREVTNVTATDIFGTPNDSNAVNVLYPGYTAGGGMGQQTYGLIPQWNNTYMNGLSTQALGLDRIMVDASGTPYRYFGPGDSRNYLPAFLQNSAAAQQNALNVISTYLSVDGYYAVSGAGSYTPNYRPYLIFYTDSRAGVTTQNYLDYARANGYSGSDDAVRQAIIAASDTAVATLTQGYLDAQPGYSSTSEANIAALRVNKTDNSDVDKNVLQYEFLIGTDVDNSRADVQSEVLNWQHFLLDSFHFDGFRFDASGHYNTDILRQSAGLMSSRYQNNIDNHLSIIESYVDAQVDFENSNRNGQLVYDADLYGNMLSSLGQGHSPLSSIITGSIAAAARNGGTAPPNWSFVNNHDQEHNVIANIPVSATQANGATPGSAAWQLAEMATYDADRQLATKQYAPYNIPAAYAFILTNKDTVPTIFYGDLYEADKPYTTVKTPYYDLIRQLLEVRKTFVAGAQKTFLYTSNTSSTAGQDLIASARLGTTRFNGVATVIGDNPALHTKITVRMGLTHALQPFINTVGNTHEVALTDLQGNLTIHVTGTSTPQVHGYLGVWVPVL